MSHQIPYDFRLEEGEPFSIKLVKGMLVTRHENPKGTDRYQLSSRHDRFPEKDPYGMNQFRIL